MKTLFIKSARKILQNKTELEEKLGVKISVKGTNTTISGENVNEHFAEMVLLALDYPFLLEEALLLLDEEYLFEVLNIKDYTRRHDIDVIKGRIIGTKGKTLRVLQDLSNCEIVVKENRVAIIGKAEDIKSASQAVISIIQGSKQGNVYSLLEKTRKQKRSFSKL